MKEGWANELGQPEAVIGARIVGVLMGCLEERGVGYIEDEYNIPAAGLQEWKDYHEHMIEVDGSAAVTKSLSLAVAQYKKAKQNKKREELGGRVLVKVRPTQRCTELWQPALRLLEVMAEQDGGYVAGQQPPTPLMMEWRQ